MGPDFLVILNGADGDKLCPSLLSALTSESAVTSVAASKCELHWKDLPRRLASPEELDCRAQTKRVCLTKRLEVFYFVQSCSKQDCQPVSKAGQAS